MKPRIVLDTSALVSALLFSSETARLLSLWKNGEILPLISKDVLLEYARVFGYSKFKLGPEDVKRLIENQILPFAEMVVVDRVIRIVPEDPGDDKFIALAEAGRATHIISGDRHLLKMVSYKGVAILSPRQFLDQMK